MKNIILCGGSGTRLWPISRKEYPKQFCDLHMDQSLFQQTIERNKKFTDEQVVVTNKLQYYTAKNQMLDIGYENNRVLLEPVGRNTAPAITLACLLLDEGEIVLVCPSDHVINNLEKYLNCIEKAEAYAEQGYIVTFGITPITPETGYGYIEADGENVLSFKEKPDMETAEAYLKAGNYYWNSGMFMFKVGTMLKELKKHAPEVLKKSKEAMNDQGKVIRIDLEKIMKIPKISIDYAVIEKSDRIKMIPSDIDWSDLGSFEALYENMETDENKNAIIGNCIVKGSTGNLILSNEKPMVVLDVDDLIVVDTDDALLISKQKSSHKVSKVIDELEQRTPNITKKHKKINRIWGSYTYEKIEKNFKVKTVEVFPHKELSLHSHRQRSEHWTVVSGVATIFMNNKEVEIEQNESWFVPTGVAHKLLNQSDEKLVIIETSVGTNLLEEDTVRSDSIED